MTPQETHRRTLFRMARLAADKGDHAEARRLDLRICELAREEAAEDEYSMRHEIKILRKHYDAQVSGAKRFELRKDDRQYATGDVLVLRVWSPEGGYDGSFTMVDVLATYRNIDGLDDDYCLMSTRLVGVP